MDFETLNCLIPAPVCAIPDGTKLAVDAIGTLSFPPEAETAAKGLEKTFGYFKKEIIPISKDGDIEFICDLSTLSLLSFRR